MTKAIASPAIRALAARKGIDLDELAQRLGRETLAREDIENAGRNPADDPASHWNVDHSAYGRVTEEPVTRMSLVAARRLVASQVTIPAATHHDTADFSAVEAFRESVKSEVKLRGIKLTALAFHVAALSKCLQSFPKFNSSLSADGRTLVLKHYCHVGIAVDTTHGLVVPVIRNADRKGFVDIAGEITDLASRAQQRKMRPDETGGASITISNLGGIGGTAFAPIVNPPEAAILGISRMKMQPIWNGKSFQPAPMVPLHLSYDHRVVNGADAARFLAHHAKLLSEPRRLLL